MIGISRNEPSFVELLSELAPSLAMVESSRFDQAMSDALGLVGSFMKVDRVYAVLVSKDGEAGNSTHQWTAGDVGPIPDLSREMAPDRIPWLTRKILDGESVVIPDVGKPDPEAVEEFALFERQGVVSRVVAPAVHAGEPLGFLGLDMVRERRRWKRRDVERLSVLAALILSCLIRHRQTLALQAAEQRFRNASLAARDIIFEVDLGDGSVWWNQAFYEILGYRPGEIERTLTRWEELIHPDDLPVVRESFVESLKSESRSSFENAYRICRKGGEYAYVGSRWRVLRNEAGRAVKLVGAVSDETDVRRMAEKLRASELRARTLIDSSSDVIVLLDHNFNITYISQACQSMLGFRPEELIGKFAPDLVNPEHRKTLETSLGELLTGKEIATTESQIRLARGGWRWVEGVARNLLDDPVIGGILVNLRDVTNRVRLERRLRRANRVSGLGEAATTFAHEFNNLLMAILPQVEVIARAETSGRSSDALDRIREAVDRGRSLTRVIQTQANPAESRPTEIRVDELFPQLEADLRAVLPSNIELVMLPPRNPVSIWFDPSRLGTIFEEVAANSVAAMPDGGQLTIDAATPPYGENEVVIRVSDTGTGIEKEHLENIFDPLYTTRLARGKGLGLTWVHHALRAHDASVEVSSRPGHGTTVHLIFPSFAAGKDALPEPQRGTSVVLIEDDAAVRAGISTLLKMEGFEVVALDRGTGATGQIIASNPQFVILDIGLPDYDGVELFHEIRVERPDQKVVFSTGHGTEDRLSFVEDDSLVALLIKPWQFSDLTAAMAKLS